MIINGEFTIIGDYFNASVTNQFLNGSLIPDLPSLFNIGSPSDPWNVVYSDLFVGTIDWTNVSNSPTALSYFDNDVGYLVGGENVTFEDLIVDSIVSNDWSNVSITESQITDLVHTTAGEPYLYDQGTQIFLNETKLNETIVSLDTDTHVAGDLIYLYNDSTTMYLNESKLNSTIQQLTGIFEENVTITVSGGVGTGVTVDCCTGANEILQVAVYPTTPTNKFRFSANGTVTGEVVDTDRQIHVGDWVISHGGTVVTDDTISYWLTSVQTDENFVVRVRYQR